MKRLGIFTALLLLWSTPAHACDHLTRLYATQTTVDFCLYVTDATVGAVKLETAAHASGDTYIMKDEGNEANTTNGFTDEGSCYSIVLTATEMTAARITLNIEDQGTKTWADKCITIDTYGNASAQHATQDVNVLSISGDSTAADNLEAWFDDTATTELSACPAGTAAFRDQLKYLFAVARNKFTQTSTTGTLFKDDGSTTLCTFSDSDNGTTFTAGEGS